MQPQPKKKKVLYFFTFFFKKAWKTAEQLKRLHGALVEKHKDMQGGLKLSVLRL